MVAMGGTRLVVYQICTAEHDIFNFSRGDTCIFPEFLGMPFSNNAFLYRSWYFVYGLMV
jgi:hypothetical protein